MAGRSSTNVSSGPYLDFQPQSENKEEQGANILFVRLPGFHKEQIRVTYVDSSRTIKVHGEGAVEKNRRSRFSQAFPVPQNCIIDKIHASFNNGVLTVTMPKRTITQVGPVKDAKATKEIGAPNFKDQKEAASTSGFEKQRDEKLHLPQTPQKATTQPKAPTAMGLENAPPKAHTNGKNVEALQPSKQQEETQKRVALVATITKQTQENSTAGSTAEIVEKKNAVKEEESGQHKDSTMSETNIPKMSEKGKRYDKSVGALEDKRREGGSSSTLGKAKEIKGMDTIMKSVKRLATDGYEDRQLLINIGVSVLVIVALGAYITYSYRSVGKPKH